MIKTGLKAANERRRKIHKALELADNLSEQLRMAGLVQRDFLPKHLPKCEGLRWATTFLPAEWVSGDIYDIARIDEQHIGFYVADVVGHGVPAALLTIFLKQALVMRETTGNSYHLFSPAEVMKNLNLRMTAQKLSGHQFVTCCYCLLNTETLELTYSRAGHPYPILIRGQEPPKQLEIQGSLLGIFEQTEYIQQTIQLQKGDKLFLYSDGAEPVIGAFDEQTGFNFTDEFCEIKNHPVDKMMTMFNSLIKDQEAKLHPKDDITAVALEIL
ncbi:MAG: serine/threonine-protein phosphatase [Planctomycetes bacterium]|nr:serine/threonine-protein phosphatase [Planctomycetota bacterium]